MVQMCAEAEAETPENNRSNLSYTDKAGIKPKTSVGSFHLD